MYLYLFIGLIVVFSAWLTRNIGKYRTDKTPPSKSTQLKDVGKIVLMAAVMLTVLSASSNYSDRRAKSGIAAYNQGRYAVAEADLRQANNFYLSEAQPHYYLGLCLLHDGNKDAALSEFRSVCSIVAHQRYTDSADRQLAAEAQSEIQQLGGEP